MIGRGWLALFAGALLVGCAHGGAGHGATLTPGAYYPLAVGNEWTYQRTYLGETGEQKVRIEKLENGYYRDNQGALLTVDADGVRDPQRYLLRQPVTTGKEWANVVSVSSTERYRIVDAHAKCAVPAGTFEDCAVVEGKNRVDQKTVLVNELSFVPHVGLVKVRVYALVGGKQIPQASLELIRYHLVAP